MDSKRQPRSQGSLQRALGENSGNEVAKTTKGVFEGRLRVVPHFSSRIVEGAKHERAPRATFSRVE